MDFIFDFIFIKPCLYVYMSLYFPTIYSTLLKLVMNKNPFLQIQFFCGNFSRCWKYLSLDHLLSSELYMHRDVTNLLIIYSLSQNIQDSIVIGWSIFLIFSRHTYQ